MSIQHSVTVRNAILQAIETAIGASPKLRLYGGAAKPAKVRKAKAAQNDDPS